MSKDFFKKIETLAKEKKGGVCAFATQSSQIPFFLNQIKSSFENVVLCDGDNLEKDLEKALMSDLFFSYKLVVVPMKEATKIQKEKIYEKLESNVSVCVLLIFDSALIAIDKKQSESFHAFLNLFNEKPWERQDRFIQIAKQIFQKEAKTIEHALVDYMVKMYDSDLEALLNEVEKLICYTANKNEVTKEDVEAIFSLNDQTNAWKLSSFFIEKDAHAIYKLIDHLVQDEQGLLALIFQWRYQLTQICEMKSHLNKDTRQDVFQKKFKLLNHNRTQKTIQGLNHFSLEELKQRLIKLLEFEFYVKQRPNVDDKITLAQLIIDP